MALRKPCPTGVQKAAPTSLPRALGNFGAPSGDRLRPWLLTGMTAVLVARVLYPSECVATEGDGLSVVMLWAALTICWLLGAIGRERQPVRLGWPLAALAFLLTWHTVAAVYATTHLAPRPAINMLWEWIGFGLLFFLGRQLIWTQREARAVVAVMLALGVGVAVQGVYQIAWEHPRILAEFEADPETSLREAGLWIPGDSPQQALFESRLSNNEPLAGFALTNSLAGFLAPWLVVGFGVLIWSRSGKVGALAILACLLPIGACLATTKSRSGWIAVALGVAAILGTRFAQRGSESSEKTSGRPWTLVAFIALLLALVVGIAWFRCDLASRAWKSFSYRIEYWQATLAMIGDHPVLGNGPGNFQNEYTRYKLPQASEEVADPHNFLLEICSTAGTPAALAFMLLIGLFFWRIHADSSKRPGGADSGTFLPAWFSLPGGVLLSLPLGMLSLDRWNWVPLWLDLPVAIVCLLLLRRWVDRGELPSALSAIAVATLLVHLSASGGIGFPGVANTMWLLLAIGLVRYDDGRSSITMPRVVSFAFLAIAVGLMSTIYSTAYQPVLTAQRLIRNVNEPSDAERACLAAAQADPWWVVPWNQLTELSFRGWQCNGNVEWLADFDRCFCRAVELDPHASPMWRRAGGHYWAIFEKTLQPKYADKAVDALGRAVELYPSRAEYRAMLAQVLHSVGDRDGFVAEAHRAIELDGLTTHADKKIPTTIRADLLRRLGQTDSPKGKQE